MSGPPEPTSSVAVPPFGPRHSSRGAPAGSTSAGRCPDACTRSATDAPSAAATLHSVAIDGLARPFSMCTSMPLLTCERAASRSSDSRRSSRRARIRADRVESSDGSPARAAAPARRVFATMQSYIVLTVTVNIMTTPPAPIRSRSG